MTYKIVRNLELIETEWRQLNSSNGSESIYESYEYAHMVWKNRIPYILILMMRPLFICFYKKEKPIAIIPLFKEWGSNSYRLFGDKAGCAYLNFIHGNSFTQSDMDNVVELLKKHFKVNLNITRVQEKTVLGKYVLEHGGKLDKEPCVFIPNWESYDEYYLSLSKNAKNNIKKAYNRAEREGKQIKFEYKRKIDFSKEDIKFINKIYSIRQSNKYRGIKKVIYYGFAQFIDVARKTHLGIPNCDILFLIRIDGEIAAFVDTAIYKQTIFLLRLAINQKYEFYNPGKVLVNELMRLMTENKEYSMFDMTHGNDRYKMEMGGVEKYCVSGVL